MIKYVQQMQQTKSKSRNEIALNWGKSISQFNVDDANPIKVAQQSVNEYKYSICPRLA